MAFLGPNEDRIGLLLDGPLADKVANTQDEIQPVSLYFQL
jgi:hypothetical protein